MSENLGDNGFPNYLKEKERCKEFIQNFRAPAGKVGEGEYKYAAMVESVSVQETTRFQVELEDVQMYDPALAVSIVQNTRRYVDLFCAALDELLPGPSRVVQEGSSIPDVIQTARINRLEMYRRSSSSSSSSSGGGAGGMDVEGPAGGAGGGGAGGRELSAAELASIFPPKLMRNYEVRFIPTLSSASKPLRLRDVGSSHIGKFVTAECMVIRATDVKPLIEVAVYACDACGAESYQDVMGKAFTPVCDCNSDLCRESKHPGTVRLQTRGSKFVKYQELRVQELPDQVPVGHIPRSLTVVCRADTTRIATPGDVVSLSGIFLPTPFTGFQAIKAGLTADTYIEAHEVHRKKKAEAFILEAEVEERINHLCDNDPYGTIAKSIAPEIFGMEDVKKALLLQLVGGVTQLQGDGMRTRGDINICLMGDPGVAKSQLLKHIAKMAPRAVYTTGRGSSGVGLTAAVIRDPLTNELTLEGGALVLADMGICCIDEFDKMDESDRTAIHEVMEQQTVSIAKAGITTTLNARTAILAAANPRYGRYNRRADPDAHVALHKNINLPAALLSRFDLLFLLLDEVDADNDKQLATHVTYVHQNGKHPPLQGFTAGLAAAAPADGSAGGAAAPDVGGQPLSPSFIRQYLIIAKHIHPTMPPHLKDYVVKAYVDMRAKDKARAGATGGRSTLTARQLLSILRLSQALARLEMRLDILQRDVDEAIRLVNASKSSVIESDSSGGYGGGDKAVDGDYLSRIWSLLRDKAVTDKASHVTLADAQQIVAGAGFSTRQFEQFLGEYEALQLLMVNPSRTRIDFVLLD